MTPKPDEPTREIPEYTPGRGRASVGWPDDADQIGKPLDVDGLDDAARQELVEPRGGGGVGRKLLVLAGVIAVLVALAFGVRSIGLWPDFFKNPFAQEQTDRSQPPLLKSIQDLSRYEAAQGNYEIIIDLQNNRRWVPDFLVNERTLFVANGSVQAYVDFGAIADGNIIVSPDGKSVEIKLPAPQLEEPNLNLEKSYVFAEERGIINRIGDLIGDGDPNRQREVYQRAEDRLAAAARDGELQQRAQENTQKMLESLLKALGYEKVTVTYVTP